MKRYIFILLSLLSLLLQAGCTANIKVQTQNKETEKTGAFANKKVTVIINPQTDSASRTAMPQIDWKSFTFILSAVENPGTSKQKASEILKSQCSNTELTAGIEIDAAEYEFTLSAYKDNIEVLSGSKIVDLTQEGNTSILINMSAVEGGTGSAQVTVKYPKSSLTSKVYASISNDIFMEKPESAVELTPSVLVEQNKIVFTEGNLPANKEQYVIFWFYDAQGNCILTRSESLFIVGGCVSTSEIEITEKDFHTYNCVVVINKDDIKWTSSGKKVVLADLSDSTKQYELSDINDGVFTGNAAESTYSIYVDDVNTNVILEAVNKYAVVDYYSVSMKDSSKCTMNITEGAIDIEKNYGIVLSGNDVKFKINSEPGYVTSDDEFGISVNDEEIENPELNEEFTISSVKEKSVIKVQGIVPEIYTITYYDGSEVIGNNTNYAYWATDYSAPVEYSVESDIELPIVSDVKKKNYIFDAWKDADGNPVKTVKGLNKNLKLYASWKDFISWDDSTKSVYANGISLLIQQNNRNTGITEIYADYNGNGIVDTGDQLVKDGKNTKNFTGYTLHAGNTSGTEINSDFTFTMTGGSIKAIYGLDSKDVKHANKSIVNISGNAKIGSAENVSVNTDSDGVKYTTAQNASGVFLETITNECVNITGNMTGDYMVYTVTPYCFDSENEHLVAYIANSDYADMNHFVCYRNEDNSPFVKNTLAMKRIYENGVQRTIIRLSDNGGIDLPKPSEVDGEITGEFSLGGSRITTGCSVFSISVEKGSFRVKDRTTITKNETAEDINAESTFTYLTILKPAKNENNLTYEETFSLSDSYVYMHVLSSGNELTSEMASDFLSQVLFKRDNPDEPLDVKINLETVDASVIAENKVLYFNGSFYKRVLTPKSKETDINGSEYYSWQQAYDAAKKESFNGLKGYLMTVTSEVENNYIYSKFNKAMSWIGGNSYLRGESYDSDTFTYGSGSANKWYWQCGPEAGMCFWNGINSKTGNKVTINGSEVFTSWNKDEPNNSGDTRKKPKGEPCLQFQSSDSDKTRTKATGYWNDLPGYSFTGGNLPSGYFVEFTPYDKYWDGSDAGANAQTASFKAVTRAATY